jgi:hypothetical protein
MNIQDDIIRRFHTAVPQVRGWIDQFLDVYADRARPVSSLGFKGLSDCFPQELLDRAKFVTLKRVPFPPVAQFGLPELAHMQQRMFDGITFKNTLFLRQDRTSEALYFHELVHVVQWSRLGEDNFLLAYGYGLLRFDYNLSPLEMMASLLQQHFKLGTLPRELVRVIENRTDAIWNQAAPFVQAGRSNTPEQGSR